MYCGCSAWLIAVLPGRGFLFFLLSASCLRRLGFGGLPCGVGLSLLFIGLLGSPLCGAALTFFAAAKKCMVSLFSATSICD
jgi:hypothetical protein